MPGLECLWNEVLFFTALPPNKVREVHELVGLELPALRWFEIDPEQLDTGRLQVYWYRYADRQRKFEKDNWSPYSKEMLSALRRVPEDTIAHYRGAAQAGRKPVAFFRTPHVLYNGNLEVSGLRTISS